MGATFVDTWRAFSADKAPRLAAAIAYATMFSLAPLFIVLIALAGTVLGLNTGGHGHHVVENALIDQVRRGAGEGTAQTVRTLIDATFARPRQGAFAQIVGWTMFVIGASGLFAALQDALNAVWHVRTSGGWKTMLRDRIASFGMIVVVGFLLLVSFAVNAAVTIAGTHFAEALAFLGGPVILHAVSWAASMVIVTGVFAAIFKVLPDVQIAWRDVWLGAFFTSVLFLIGQELIALYLSLAGVASAYGAAGSLLVGLLWIYYSALILLLGAEFTKVRSRRARG
jgi:membrane protein